MKAAAELFYKPIGKERRGQLTANVIAITGGARGLGFAVAQRLGQQGASF